MKKKNFTVRKEMILHGFDQGFVQILVLIQEIL